MAPKQQRGTVAWGSSKRGASPSAPKAAPKAGGEYRPRNRLTTMFSRDKSRAPRKVHVAATAPSPADDASQGPTVRLYDDPEAMAQKRREIDAHNAAKDAALARAQQPESSAEVPHSAAPQASKKNPWLDEAVLGDSLFDQYTTEKRLSVAQPVKKGGSRKSLLREYRDLRVLRSSRISIFAPKPPTLPKYEAPEWKLAESRRDEMKAHIKRSHKTAEEIKSQLNAEQLDDLEFQTWLADLVEEEIIQEPRPRGCLDWLCGWSKDESETLRIAAVAAGLELETIEAGALKGQKEKKEKKGKKEKKEKKTPSQTEPEPGPVRDRRRGDAKSVDALKRGRAATKIQAVARMYRSVIIAERMRQVRDAAANPPAGVCSLFTSFDSRGRVGQENLLDLESENARKGKFARNVERQALKAELADAADKKQKEKLKKYYGNGTYGADEVADRNRGATRAQRGTCKTARDPSSALRRLSFVYERRRQEEARSDVRGSRYSGVRRGIRSF